MTTIKTSPLHSDFVVQVHASVVDLLNSAAAIEELKSLWQKSPVMIFRRQSLEEAELVRFTEQFGVCETTGRKDIQSPYQEQIIYFSTLKYADGHFVGGFAGGDDVDWHSDQTYQVRPATGAMLYGTEVPRDGGDIYWADQYAAWERLPKDIQQLIDGKLGVFRYAKRYAILNTLELKDKEKANAMLSLPDAKHQLVLTHPISGRKSLYADPTTLVAIEGLSEAEAARVMPILFEAGGDPVGVYRHKVHNGDLLMWDNGVTMHRRDEMRLDQPRLMKRTTFRLPASQYAAPQA